MTVWAGQLISGLGSGMTAFALGVYVYNFTNSATGFATVLLCAFLPSIILKPFGGVWADRFNRKTMIIIGDLGTSIGVLFILAVFLMGNLLPWHIYVGVTISSFFNAMQNPAYKALITDLLTEDQFSRGGGMIQLASSAQHLLAPLLAGLLMSIHSIAIILIIDLCSFFTAVAMVLATRGSGERMKGEGPIETLKALREGWDTVISRKGIMTVTLIISLVTFFVGFLQTLYGPMVLSFSDARTLGISQTISATGMVLSSVILGTRRGKRNHAKMLTGGLALAGFSLILMGLHTSIVYITASFFMFFLALPLINTGADVLVRRNIPNSSQGRAWSIIGVISQIGFPVAYVLSGRLADNIFTPLMSHNGILSNTIGRFIGTGPGRGIALMFILSGIGISLVALASSGSVSLRSLEFSHSPSIEKE